MKWNIVFSGNWFSSGVVGILLRGIVYSMAPKLECGIELKISRHLTYLTIKRKFKQEDSSLFSSTRKLILIIFYINKFTDENINFAVDLLSYYQ